jgi:hypothetical protein
VARGEWQVKRGPEKGNFFKEQSQYIVYNQQLGLKTARKQSQL